ERGGERDPAVIGIVDGKGVAPPAGVDGERTEVAGPDAEADRLRVPQSTDAAEGLGAARVRVKRGRAGQGVAAVLNDEVGKVRGVADDHRAVDVCQGAAKRRHAADGHVVRTVLALDGQGCVGTGGLHVDVVQAGARVQDHVHGTAGGQGVVHGEGVA